MEDEKIKCISFRLDEQLVEKLYYIAEYEARSLNGQVLVLARNCISQFEKEHGVITEEDIAKVRAHRKTRQTQKKKK